MQKSLPLLLLALCPPLFAGAAAHWDFDTAAERSSAFEAVDKVAGLRLVPPGAGQAPVQVSSVPGSGAGSSANLRSAGFSRANRTSLQVEAETGLDFDEGAPFTIEFWLNPRSLPAATNDSVASFLVQKRGGDASSFQKPGYQIVLNFEGKILFRAEGQDGGGKTVKSEATLPLDRWTHVALSRDTAGVFTLYIDGKADAVSGGPRFTASLQNDAPLVLGANRFAQNPQFFFDGLLDEFRISDTALTPDQFLRP